MYGHMMPFSRSPLLISIGEIGPEIYSEEQLQLPSKLAKRRKMVVTRQTKVKPQRPNEAWSMEFVANRLSNGMKYRVLTIVDLFSKESLVIEVVHLENHSPLPKDK